MLKLFLSTSLSILVAQSALVQVVNNKPYGPIDLFVDGRVQYEDLEYQESTRPISVPVEAKIGVSPRGQGISEEIRVSLRENGSYMLVVNGIADNLSFPVTLKISELDEDSNDDQIVGVKFLHGVTDAPPVDVYFNRQLMIEGQRYGEENELLEITPGDYNIGIMQSRTNILLASFTAPLSGFSGSNCLILASGFINPADNDSSLTLILSSYGEESIRLEPSESNVLELDREKANVPDRFHVLQNYPNPFNPTTTIRYDLLTESLVKITIYDIMGNTVSQLFSGMQSVGKKNIVWDATTTLGKPVSSGIYLYEVEVGNSSKIKRMMYLK